MGGYSSPTVMYAILIGLAIVAVFFIINRRKKHATTAKATNDNASTDMPKKPMEPALCVVCDDGTGRWNEEEVPGEALQAAIDKHKSLGKRLKRNNKDVYLVKRDTEGNYAPILPRRTSLLSSVALFQKSSLPYLAAPYIYNLQVDKSFMQKYGQIIWWIAVMAFVGFLYMSGD